MNVLPDSLRGYRRAWLARDVTAGAVLSAVAIPEVMGYTSISQTTLQTGLYTIIFPTVVFALLGSSRLMVVGADSATAAVLAAGLGGLGVAGLTAGSDLWVAYASVTALVCGVMLAIARLLRLGFIGDFLSTSVLVGFLTGVGIQVLSSQIPGMLGVPKSGGTWFEQQWSWLTSIDDAHLATLGFAALTVVCIAFFGRFLQAVPGALVAVVASIAVSALTDARSHGVAVVGSVPSGLPPLGLPDVPLEAWWQVLPTAFSCFVLIVAQSAATSRSFAAKHGQNVDVNQDITGLSGAQIAAGLSGTFVVNGSPTKTEILDQQRGRTQVANLTMAAIVLLFTLFFTGVLAQMPLATLAGIVFMVGFSLIDVPGLDLIRRERYSEFVVATLTAVTVFALGVEEGIIVAVVASLLEIVRRSYSPRSFVMGTRSAGGTDEFVPARPGEQSKPGLVVFRFDAPLYYANAGRFVDSVKAIVENAPDPVRWVVILGETLNDIDYSAGVKLRDLAGHLAGRNVTVAFAGLDTHQVHSLTNYGVLGGRSRVLTFPHVAEAVAAFDAEDDAPPPGPG